MRIVHWLFLVSVALFISGIGFIIASARGGPEAAPAEQGLPVTPVATVKQIMAGITMPAAYVVFDSVATIVSAAGTEETAAEDRRRMGRCRRGRGGAHRIRQSSSDGRPPGGPRRLGEDDSGDGRRRTGRAQSH